MHFFFPFPLRLSSPGWTECDMAAPSPQLCCSRPGTPSSFSAVALLGISLGNGRTHCHLSLLFPAFLCRSGPFLPSSYLLSLCSGPHTPTRSVIWSLFCIFSPSSLVYCLAFFLTSSSSQSYFIQTNKMEPHPPWLLPQLFSFHHSSACSGRPALWNCFLNVRLLRVSLESGCSCRSPEGASSQPRACQCQAPSCVV